MESLKKNTGHTFSPLIFPAKFQGNSAILVGLLHAQLKGKVDLCSKQANQISRIVKITFQEISFQILKSKSWKRKVVDLQWKLSRNWNLSPC